MDSSVSTKHKQKSAIYYGSFIHCESPTKLSIRDGYLWVDEDGNIGGFAEEKEVESPGSLIESLGWSKDTPLVESGKYGFFFPGFIGRFLSPVSKSQHMALFRLPSFMEHPHQTFPRFCSELNS
jgi:hypothetical protein